MSLNIFTKYKVTDICEFNKQTKQVLKLRKKKDFSDSLKEVINTLTIQDDTVPVGSFKYEAFRYPGDIDMMEKVVAQGNDGNGKDILSNRIKNVVRRVDLSDNIYFSELKAGVDKPLMEDLKQLLPDYDYLSSCSEYINKLSEQLGGSESDNQHLIFKMGKYGLNYYPETETPNASTTLPLTKNKILEHISQHILDEKTFLTITKVLKQEARDKILKAAKDLIQSQNYGDGEVESFPVLLEKLCEAIRKPGVLRWNVREILKGRHPLLSGGSISLADSISMGTVVKLDVWAIINDKFTEVTNFFMLYIEKKGQKRELTVPFSDYSESLYQDLLKYSGEEHYDPLKVCKRFWMWLSYTHNTTKADIQRYINGKSEDSLAASKKLIVDRILNQLADLFAGKYASLKQVVADLEVIRDIFGHSSFRNPSANVLKKITKNVGIINKQINNNYQGAAYSQIQGFFANSYSLLEKALADKRKGEKVNPQDLDGVVADMSSLIDLVSNIVNSKLDQIFSCRYIPVWIDKYNKVFKDTILTKAVEIGSPFTHPTLTTMLQTPKPSRLLFRDD